MRVRESAEVSRLLAKAREDQRRGDYERGLVRIGQVTSLPQAQGQVTSLPQAQGPSTAIASRSLADP